MGDHKEEQSETRIEEEVGRLLEQVKELQEAAASFISKSSKEEQNLRQRAVALDSSILKLRSSINTLLFNRHLDPKLAEKVFLIYFFYYKNGPNCFRFNFNDFVVFN